jgi:hypothetical protein
MRKRFEVQIYPYLSFNTWILNIWTYHTIQMLYGWAYVKWSLQVEYQDMKDTNLMSPQLNAGNWKTVLEFLVDVFEHLNKLSVNFRGRDLLIHELYTTVPASMRDLVSWTLSSRIRRRVVWQFSEGSEERKLNKRLARSKQQEKRAACRRVVKENRNVLAL